MRNHCQGKIIFILLITSCQCYGQAPISDTSLRRNSTCEPTTRYYRNHDTIWIYNCLCKIERVRVITGSKARLYLKEAKEKNRNSSIPFLKIHGNVQYDFTYRSFVDTPFSQSNFTQHTIQTTFDFTIRDLYAVKMTLLNRRSNSPYFDDITDVNLQFNQGMFLNNLKEKLYKRIPASVSTDKLNEAENLYKQKQEEIEDIRKWLEHPARVQEIIEEKEKLAKNEMTDARNIPDEQNIKEKISNTINEKVGKINDSLNAISDSLIDKRKLNKDSILNAVGISSRISKIPDSLEAKIDSLAEKGKTLVKYEKRWEEYNKALAELKEQKQKFDDTKKSVQDSLSQLKQKLMQVKDPSSLKDFVRQNNLDSKDLPRGWQTLSIINTIGLGRTWVDYSDLTVKNVSLNGVNAELTPSGFYFAFAAGKVNYRFRDFIMKSNQRSKQSLYLVRTGIGKREGNNLIFTWYDGKKDFQYRFGNITDSGRLEKVSGISLESRLQINNNNYFILEVAKSSYRIRGSSNRNKIWNLNDRSNEAYSIKINSFWPQTNTKITGYYRKMGEHFQSFNLQPINVNQEAYQLKLQQSFWKRRLIIEAGIRKNDFSSSFINPGVSTTTVFKSIQASLRIHKYPFISIGYFPSSQLTFSENKTLVENQYNTLNILVSHTYRLKNLNMISNIVYLKFYNTGMDTGFIYYNASSWFLNQYFYFKGLRLQSGMTLTSQKNLKVVMVEESIGYQLRKWLVINGSLKYNQLNTQNAMWGGSAGIGIIFKKIGTIQMNYDKSYLPGTQRNLLPMEMGRLNYIRTF